jgi:pSer/pThr/pTyr-binding forkhead associated (FHA) protein
VIVPTFALTVLKFVFLALLYFFVYRAVRSVVVDVRGTAARGAIPRSSKAEARPPSPPAERRGKRPRELLLVDERGKKAASFRLEGAMQIGRADACHVKLSDTYVSQFHARVFPKDGAWFVEDLGSTNGTFLNQRKVTAPSELRGGDKLRMGKTMLELRS